MEHSSQPLAPSSTTQRTRVSAIAALFALCVAGSAQAWGPAPSHRGKQATQRSTQVEASTARPRTRGATFDKSRRAKPRRDYAMSHVVRHHGRIIR